MSELNPPLPWPIRPRDPEACAALAGAAKVPEPVATLLLNRDITTPEAARAFLSPTLADLPSPFLMQDMEEAMTLLIETIRTRQPIVIYGDYDVDGLTGSAMLLLFLRQAGATVTAFQPDRLTDGYGLHAHLLEKLRQELPAGGTPLLITVDCGITSHGAVTRARELGFRVLVTDHHQPEAALPAADAILNPHRADCPFPFKGMAGAGVAFYLIMGLRSRLTTEGAWQTPPNLKEYLDFVALGTVADMVELTGVNRVLTKAGLEVLSQRKRAGLASLCEIAGLGATIRAEDIAFQLAPRLNAASRLGSAATAFRLLTTGDAEEAYQLASALDQANQERRKLAASVYDAVRPQAEAAVRQGKGMLIFADASWHHGVLGIVASRLSREFQRPALIFAVREGVARGSGRSVGGIDLLGMLECGAEYLQEYGGHPMALGATLAAADLAEFTATMERVAAMVRPEDRPAFTVELVPEGKELDELLAWYPHLEPFGAGNPEPLLAGRAVPQDWKIVGGRHARFRWPVNGRGYHDAILFNLPETEPKEQPNRPMDFAFSLRRNLYQGREKWQLHGKALHFITSCFFVILFYFT
ncbi:MAG: single-stranded-DNA-specific exonuclease RecJ [Thermodesulfobacteriota bacterium]